MTDLPGGLLGGAANLVGGVLGGAGDLVGGVLGGATQVVAKTGDTLGSIADAHGVPLSSVVEANPQVLHPDLVQPGQAISVPQPAPPPGPDTGQAPVASPPGGGLVEGLGQTVAQTANAAGSLLGQTVGAAGALAGRTVEATGVAVSPALAQSPSPGAPTSVGGALPSSSGETAPPTALPEAPVSVSVGQGSVDFRVLAQAAPPLAPTQAAAPGAPTLMQALAGIDPALAQLLAGALASPTLSTPATPAQLAKLEAALLSLGWAAVSLGLAKPGDVVLLLRAAMLQAARVPAEGLIFQGSDDGDGPSGASPSRAYAPPSGPPPGIDAAGPQRLRGRAAGDREAEASRAGADRERKPVESPQRAWIARALPTAITVKARWGVPVAVTIAQGALASDWGRAAPGNDYFGLGERRGGRVALPPPDAGVPALRGAAPVAVTGAFEDVDDAAQAFGAFVSETPAFARAFRAPDAKAFARRLGEAGFSRDPVHGERLAELIDTYALTALDG